jgi:hypothetical protein
VFERVRLQFKRHFLTYVKKIYKNPTLLNKELYVFYLGHGSVVVKALCYKAEGRGLKRKVEGSIPDEVNF